jgi:hypothetical protein
MHIREIKNGSLYFNKKRGRSERVRSKDLNASSVVVSFHGDNLLSAKTSDLEMASSAQVEEYKRRVQTGSSVLKEVFS